MTIDKTSKWQLFSFMNTNIIFYFSFVFSTWFDVQNMVKYFKKSINVKLTNLECTHPLTFHFHKAGFYVPDLLFK